MHLDSNMVRNEAHDPLGVGGVIAAAGVLTARRQGDRSRDARPD